MASKLNTKIDNLLESSREVLLDCTLDNGAIVAANTDHPAYPKNASNYRYVWPRDAAFMIQAMSILGISKEDEFSGWLIDRAEGFHRVGLFFRRYATNGSGSWPDDEFQPDQAGAMLWALSESAQKTSRVDEAITKIANGLCRDWGKDHFTSPTHDLWEHIRIPETNGSFSYALATCSTGLKLAAKTVTSEDRGTWIKIAEEMQSALEISKSSGYYSRTNNSDNGNIDGSLSGLVWPFPANDKQKLRNTLAKIKKDLLMEMGVMRFAGDTYDGLVLRSTDLEQGGGAWPILTFWYAIARHELGNEEEAAKVFENQIYQLKSKYVPEQIFSDGRQGIAPLGWSHAMFVIAAHRLGYL